MEIVLLIFITMISMPPYEVIDPELFVSWWIFGSIYDIDFSNEKIKVTMTLSTFSLPHGWSYHQRVKNALEKNFREKKRRLN